MLDTNKTLNDQFQGREGSLVAQIIGYFKWNDRYHLFRVNSGKVKAEKWGRYYWVHLAPIGTPDIIGFDKVLGCFIGIETKVKKNKLSAEQAAFAKSLRNTKRGVYILARSLDDVLDVLEPRENLPF